MAIADVTLIGWITKNKPLKLRMLSEDKSVVTFSMSIPQRYKNKDGDWTTEQTFVDVEAWGSRAEAFVKHHSPGDATIIFGKLKMHEWVDKNTGKRRTKLLVKLRDWQFVPRKTQHVTREDKLIRDADAHLQAWADISQSKREDGELNDGDDPF